MMHTFECSGLPPPFGSKEWEAKTQEYRNNMMKSSFIPYLNGLAQTCRLAYKESSHILYQENRFSFDSAASLQCFAYRSLPSHVQAIQNLEVTGLTLPSKYGNPHHICLGRLKLFQPFASLTTLYLKERRELFAENGPILYAEKLMIELVRVGNTMEALQTIFISSSEWASKIPLYSLIQLDFDRIPDWIYTDYFIQHPRLAPHQVWLLETLKRVHRPLGPRQRDEPIGDCPGI